MKAETEAWLASAESDAAAARLLTANGFHQQAVFHVHLSIEKTLKALVCEGAPDGEVPRTHDLRALLQLVIADGSEWLLRFFARLSLEEIAARYTLPPSNSRYTFELATALLEEAQEAREWLRQQLT